MDAKPLKKYLENYPVFPLDEDLTLVMVKEEEKKQRLRWGPQNITLFEWNTILAEEVGELAKAIMEHEYRGADRGPIIHEATQVAMIACKIMRLTMIHGRYRHDVNPKA